MTNGEEMLGIEVRKTRVVQEEEASNRLEKVREKTERIKEMRMTLSQHENPGKESKDETVGVQAESCSWQGVEKRKITQWKGVAKRTIMEKERSDGCR